MAIAAAPQQLSRENGFYMQAANNSRRSLKPSKPPRHAPVMTLRGLPADPAHLHFASRRHPQPVGILDAGLLDGAMQLGGLAEPPAEEHQVSSTCRTEALERLSRKRLW